MWHVPTASFATLSRRNSRQAFQDLLTKSCDISVEVFDITSSCKEANNSLGAPISAEKDHWGRLNVVKLTFASVRAAQCRAAMLMLATYDPMTRCSVQLFSRLEVLQR
jgi:hypothetical protein